MSHEYLDTLGLCLRAGKLTAGIEAVLDAIPSSKTRLAVLSCDAGENTVRSVMRAAKSRNLPVIQVAADSQEIGAALGRMTCAVCTISEIGFAAAIANKAAAESPKLAETAKLLSEKNTKIASRRGKKKPKHTAKTENGTAKTVQTNRKKRGGERA